MSRNLIMGGVDYHNKTSAPWLSTEIFMQGCYKNCPECFNQRLRSFESGVHMDWEDLYKSLVRHVPYRCVTFSGGEPMLQAKTLTYLAKSLKDSGFTICCYTGYQAEELPYLFPDSKDLLQYIDVLIDGMFIRELLTPIDKDYKFTGSSNQRIINVQKSLDTSFIELWTDKDTKEVLENERYVFGFREAKSY